jgi:serine/threonine protein kinase
MTEALLGKLGDLNKILEHEAKSQPSHDVVESTWDVRRTDPLALIEGRPPSAGALHQSVIDFFREIFAHVRGRGPAVLRIHAWNVANERSEPEFVLVTEKMRGSLARDPGTSLNLNPTEKMIVLYGVARGMAHLHSMQVLHRDLSPGSIFLDDRKYPRIGHMILAKVTTDANQSRALANTGYQAPEVVKSAAYSFPADVYSYAIIFVELVEGVRRSPAATSQTAFWHLPPIHLRLLQRLSSEFPERRLPFSVIVRKLQKRKYWLPGTDEAEFRQYVHYLDGLDKKLASKRLESQSKWLKDLIQNDQLYGTNLLYLFELCEYGDFAGQIVAALLYLTGNIAQKDTAQALKLLKDNFHLPWVRVLLKLFSVGSPFQRAVMHEIDGQLPAALSEYKKAALEGDLEAVLRYGSLLLFYGCESVGLTLVELVASTGHIRANFTLGDYFFRWKGNPRRALQYFKMCADREKNTQFAEPYLIVARILVQLGQLDEAFGYLCDLEMIEGPGLNESQRLKTIIRARKVANSRR